MNRIREGKVTRVQPRRVLVDIDGASVPAVLRGQLKAGPRRTTNVVAVGDEVRVLLHPGRTARIEEVLPRRNKISRVDPGSSRATIEQVLASNLDWLVAVVSLDQPPLNLRGLDRLLVLGEVSGISPLIVLNKVDLAQPDDPDPLQVYETIGYQVSRTCAITGEGCADLRTLLETRVCLLSGPSGVGKTSLLNVILPGVNLRTRPISRATGKGVHTTTRVDYYPVTGGGAILDSPGIRSIQPWGLEPRNLGGCFPEFRETGGCHFRDCVHREEPDCAVKDAVEQGTIDPDRYQSYLRILAGLNRLGPRRDFTED